LASTFQANGEFGKAMGHRINYGAWWSYSFQRLGGLEFSGPGLDAMPAHRSRPGETVLTSFGDRRDRTQFADAYNVPDSGINWGTRAPQGNRIWNSLCANWGLARRGDDRFYQGG